MAHTYSPSKGQVNGQDVHSILCAPDRKRVFASGRWFSKSSLANVFEIRGAKGAMRCDLRDEEISALLNEHPKNKSEQQKQAVHTRIIFINEVKDDVDRLCITSELLQDIFATYGISSRVASLLRRQHMPGRVVQYDPISQKPIHHQFWYSAIVRSREEVKCLDSSKSILCWMRFCVWAGRDITTGITTILALRCPQDMKKELVSAFENRGEMIQQHPMLLHAFFAQNVLQKADHFSESWADPIYEWELKTDENGSAAHFTTRSVVFLTLTRQITQVATDYEILGPTLQHLKSEYEWISAQSNSDPSGSQTSPFATDCLGICDIWDVYIAELQLLRTYANLYKTRTKIAINECFAMVNQRDSEVNIQMAKESTQIARTSHQDGRSLRTIQILTMIFLPASLFSGIFGMGFFNTGPDDNGNVIFSVSSNWWWFLAVTIPVTILTLASIGGRQVYERWRVQLKKVASDKEKDYS